MDFNDKELSTLFGDKIEELKEEPEFQWSKENTKHHVDKFGKPALKVAIGNVPLDYDLWEGLRNPAVVGLHPIGLREIWDFYSNRRKMRVDEFGRQSIFQIPRSFDFAKKKYNRAVIVSVMLPFSLQVINDYAQFINDGNKGSSHRYSRMYEDINSMFDKAVSRVAIDIVDGDNVVVAMNNDNVEAVSEEAIPQTHQGVSHGPSKGGNYPQKSIAVMMGLGQFGVSRIVFRDELVDGDVQRFAGPIRSIIVFDDNDLVKGGDGEIIYPNKVWREFLFRLYDFTDTDPLINQYRFCTYIPQDDAGCRKCVGCCPSGAQPSSVPTSDGGYSNALSRQKHRFWDGKLQFDFGKCCDDRGQMMSLYPEWSCSRCVSICIAQGNRRQNAARSFYEKMSKMTQ